MSVAKTMLVTTDLPVSLIARKAGFTKRNWLKNGVLYGGNLGNNMGIPKMEIW